MESFGTNITEFYLIEKAMDMQIGALNAEKTIPSNQRHHVNLQSSGLRHLDPETDFKVRRIASRVNEAIQMSANEPTLGLFRIQEHIYRTLPQLVHRKTELKTNMNKIEGTVYDLNLSMQVIDSISKIKTFTRIQEALKTAIEIKQKLNLLEEQEKARLELNAKNAKDCNKSLSLYEPAEGYICPVCYFALTSQDELILHWQKAHSLDKYENDVFQEVELPTNEVKADTEYIVKQDNDLTVIEISKPHISECEDVVNSFDNLHELDESSASDASNNTHPDSLSTA